MKTKIVLLIGSYAFLGCSSLAVADDFRDMLFGTRVPDCIAARQCDDYCPKQIPCTRPLSGKQCDDYCSKRIPCTQPLSVRQCDDYCSKTLPRVCCKKRVCFTHCVSPQTGQVRRKQFGVERPQVLTQPIVLPFPGPIKQAKKPFSTTNFFQQ